MENLNDRMAINLTMLLTAMAFKWVLSDMLPKVTYLTVMEKYVVMTFMLLFAQGLWFWIASSFHATLCRGEHWIYGTLPISSSTAGGGENGGGGGGGSGAVGEEAPGGGGDEVASLQCQLVFLADSAVMWLLGLGIAVLHGWLYSFKFSGGSKHNFKRDGLKILTDNSLDHDEIRLKFESGAVPAATKQIKNR